MFGALKVRTFVSLALACLTPVSSALAWGKLGHRVVAKVGADLASEGELFWGANTQSLMTFSNTPDLQWKSGAGGGNEKPTHWFHFDVYSPDGSALPTLFQTYAGAIRAHSEAMIIENGTGIWRVQQFFLAARDSLTRGDEAAGLQWAGALAHYVGDLAQPLHVTHNYDGQLTGQSGLHAWFESKNLERTGEALVEERVHTEARRLLASPEFRAQTDTDLMRSVLLGVQRSAAEVKAVLANDLSLGREGAGADTQLDVAVTRMADGAATYALLLSRLWHEGGRRDEAKSLTPRQPTWMSPDFSRAAETAECL